VEERAALADVAALAGLPLDVSKDAGHPSIEDCPGKFPPLLVQEGARIPPKRPPPSSYYRVSIAQNKIVSPAGLYTNETVSVALFNPPE
jgi:hypothetical protein